MDNSQQRARPKPPSPQLWSPALCCRLEGSPGLRPDFAWLWPKLQQKSASFSGSIVALSHPGSWLDGSALGAGNMGQLGSLSAPARPSSAPAQPQHGPSSAPVQPQLSPSSASAQPQLSFSRVPARPQLGPSSAPAQPQLGPSTTPARS